MRTLIDPLVMDKQEERTFEERKSERLGDKKIAQLKEIANLDLDCVKKRLCAPLESVGENWDELRAMKAVECYRAFLKLHVFYPNKTFVPTRDIDECWHHHVLFTKKYMDDCQSIFGKYLHHAPREHAQEEATLIAKQFAETKDLLLKHFGIKLEDEQKADCCPFPWC